MLAAQLFDFHALARIRCYQRWPPAVQCVLRLCALPPIQSMTAKLLSLQFAHNPKITINGINRLFTNRPRTLAVGVAGQLQDHTYAAGLHETEDVIGALEGIHSHIGALHARGDRRVVIENRPATLNEGLATFFDVATGEFFTDMFFFTPKNIHSRRHHVSTGEAILLHVGSGSTVLENAVRLDNINAFLGARLPRTISDPQQRQWGRRIGRGCSKQTRRGVVSEN